MSAIELVKQVQALPTRERERFFLAILMLEEEPGRPNRKPKPLHWPDVEVRAKRIFGNRLLPNLVLLEREESAF